MKRILALALIVTSLLSCKKGDNTAPETPSPRTLNVYTVDNDNVSILRQNLDGTAPKSLVAHQQDAGKNVFIGDVSANTPITKIAYLLRKGEPGAYLTELHLAGADGSNDRVLKSYKQNNVYPHMVKIGNNGIIYYAYRDFNNDSYQLYSINENGTGETKISGVFRGISDITADGKYVVALSDLSNFVRLNYFDVTANGDVRNALYTDQSIPGLQQARISPDGKKLIALYLNNGIKCRIIDLATKKYTDVSITTGFGSATYHYMSLAPDNDKIIFMAKGSSSSTSYIYSQTSGQITQFNNVTNGVYQGYIF
jgi:Tol biopolymer transport system component